MFGKRHTPEAKAEMLAGIRRAWEPGGPLRSEEQKQRRSDAMLARIASGKMRSGYERSAGGRRADLGNVYFRSSWEANYARYLNWRMARGEVQLWEYEPKTFVFECIKRGTRAYTPDFRVVFPDGHVEWHEVKGWMDQKSRTRLARMTKYFPEEVVRLIDETWYRMAKSGGLSALIHGWEYNGRGNRGA